MTLCIGLDLDNTIIDYHGLFHALAVEQGWLPAGESLPKSTTRDLLRAQPDGEKRWRSLQAMVYGERILEAQLAEGVREFLERCAALGVEVYIVSHKTRQPSGGEGVDLHEAARLFLARHGIAPGLVAGERVFFEPTRTAKAARIAALGCTHFVDDLPEMFAHAHFPDGVERVLYRPASSLEPGEPHALWDAVESFPLLRQRLLADLELAGAAKRMFGSEPASRADLSGGRNSRVQLLTWPDGRQAVCKQYAVDGRGRLEAELRAFHFLARAQIRCTPKLLGADVAANCLFLEPVQGKAFGSSPVTRAEMDALHVFLRQLAAARTLTEAGQLPPASEACLAGADYGRVCRNRLARLRTVAGAELAAFLDELEAELVLREKECVAGYETAGLDMAAALPVSACIPSPSDLGFHNALRTGDGRVVFFDFEFFGLDDPAKLIADFLWHPAMHLPAELTCDFGARVAAAMGEGAAILRRVELVLPLVGLKWCLLLLNEFLVPELARRHFAGPARDNAEKKQVQLDKARAMLARVQQGRNFHAQGTTGNSVHPRRAG